MLLEKLERVAVLLEVTRGEALVGTIEGGEELLSLDNLEDLLPLGLSGVDSSWVVGTDVEHDNGVILSGVKIFLQALEVEALGLLAVVAVILPFVADEVSDRSMDGPGRVGDKEVDVLVGVPLREESETEAESTSARDRLGTSDSALLTGTTVLTVGKSEALLDVRVDTVDGSVLVIHVALKDELLGALDARKDEWLAFVISVGSHAEEDLLGAGLLLEGVVETENRVCGSGGQS